MARLEIPFKHFLFGFTVLIGLFVVIGINSQLGEPGYSCESFDAYWNSIDAENLVYEYPNGTVAMSYESDPERINMTVWNSYAYDCLAQKKKYRKKGEEA